MIELFWGCLELGFCFSLVGLGLAGSVFFWRWSCELERAQLNFWARTDAARLEVIYKLYFSLHGERHPDQKRKARKHD